MKESKYYLMYKLQSRMINIMSLSNLEERNLKWMYEIIVISVTNYEITNIT